MKVFTMQNSFLDPKSLKDDWATNPRWKGITRNYSAEDVISIRNSVEIKHTLAENGAQKLFEDLINSAASSSEEPPISPIIKID